MGSTPSFIVGEDVYVKGRVFGKGSFGKVYLMKHKATGKNRVFKEMSKAEILKKSKGSVQMLIREREFLSTVHGCPYVIKCYASIQDKENLYLLMEFCEGGEFQYFLDTNATLTESELKIYLAQMVWGLNELHTKYNLIHRDIKPDNCLIDEFGMITIIDFGVAEKLDENGVYVNDSRRIAGTLYYMAPEVLEGCNHSPKVDWWSLGILAYESIHKRKPFICGSTFPEQRQLINANINFSSDVSTPFQNFIRGLLTINVEKRFDFQEIRSHEFFQDIDWELVAERKLRASFIPSHGTLYFRKEANMNSALGIENTKNRKLSEDEQSLFDGWEWVFGQGQPSIAEKKDKCIQRKDSKSSLSRSGRKKEVKEMMNQMEKEKEDFENDQDCNNSINSSIFNQQEPAVVVK